MSKAKQAILRAIAIKLEVETHKKYRRVMTKLTWLVFIAFLGYGLYNSVTKYSQASAIMSDVGYLEASTEQLPNYISDTQSSYRYSFTIDENKYENDFVASHESYKKFMGTQGIRVAYKKGDPSKSGIGALVDKNNSIGGILKHFALMFFAGGLGFMIIYMFLTNGIVQPKVEYDEDEEHES